MKPALLPRNCPLCADRAGARVFLPSSIKEDRVTRSSYASRKEPEYMSYELLECGACQVVFASEAPSSKSINEAYHRTTYDSATEASLAASAYESALTPFLKNLPHHKGLLEIGAGTGAFIERLVAYGFSPSIGIEPSTAAIQAASPVARRSLTEGVFEESAFEAASFSLICCFMTLEHVYEPGEMVCACFRLLAPGGMVALATHDYKAWVNRLLGRRSPIIDIEHLQLFSQGSLRRLLVQAGFVGIEVHSLINTYHLSYWHRLFPWPARLKQLIARFLDISGLGKLRVALNVGNIMAVGWKR